MTYLGPYLAGLIVGIVVASFVLHWLIGLADILSSRSSKPSAQVTREALMLTIANSGFWILVVAAYATYYVLSRPLDRPLIAGVIGFASAIALLCVIAYGFARGGPSSLLMRFAEAGRHKANFMRFGLAVSIIVSAPILYEWHEQGVSAGFLVLIALVWGAGFYFLIWYIWQFAPWDKQGLVRNKKGGGSNAA
jgi:hypothetical protein